LKDRVSSLRNSPHSTVTGYAAIAASCFCFGFLGYFGKVGYSLGYTPVTLMTVRFLLAALILWIMAVYRGLKLYRVTSTALPLLVLQGVAMTGTSFGYFASLQYLSASLAAIVFYLHPVLTIAVTTVFLRERFTWPRGLALTMAVLGTTFISGGFGNGNVSADARGLMWILAGAASYSVFTLIGQRTTRGMDSIVVTTYALTFCALGFALMEFPVYMFNGSLTPAMWAVGLGIGFICSVLAILLYVVGIRAVGAARASVASALEPLSGVLLAAVLLGERLVPVQWIGMSVILLAVIVLQADKPHIAV
jgi:drug/metabolite transporter (DMT)-like permease